MRRERRAAVYDGDLRVEAYRLEGVSRPFPKHFHEYYVIGLVEAGERMLCCQEGERLLRPGDVLLLNPGARHACAQADGGILGYRGLNVAREVMAGWAGDGGKAPLFGETVVRDAETAAALSGFHKMVMDGAPKPAREESLRALLSMLAWRCAQPCAPAACEGAAEVEKLCALMKRRFAERLDLDALCRYAGLSKSTLLRAFTRAKGITPHAYLENVRVGAAKKLLARGVPPADVALRAGFSDQSHFTNCFHRFIGLTPGDYRDIFAGKGGTRRQIEKESERHGGTKVRDGD